MWAKTWKQGSRDRPSPPGPGQTAGQGPGGGPGPRGPGGQCVRIWGAEAGLRPLQAGAVPRQRGQGRGSWCGLTSCLDACLGASHGLGVRGPALTGSAQAPAAVKRSGRNSPSLQESVRGPRAEAWERAGGQHAGSRCCLGPLRDGGHGVRSPDLGCVLPSLLRFCGPRCPRGARPGRWAPGVWAHVYGVPAAVRPGRSRPRREEGKGAGGAVGLSVATAVTSMWSHDPWTPGAADRVRRVRDQGGLPADGAELNPKGRWR